MHKLRTLSSDLCAIGKYTALMGMKTKSSLPEGTGRNTALAGPPALTPLIRLRAGVECTENVLAASIVAKIDPPVGEA